MGRQVRGYVAAKTIGRVRDRTDLVALVRERVPTLTGRGGRFVGPCPFHKGRKPTFHVHARTGVYHCFRCKVSGDAITFVEHFERRTFSDAIRALARRAGVALS